MYIYMYTHIRAHIHTYIYTYNIYTYTIRCTHLETHIDTHTHTYTSYTYTIRCTHFETHRHTHILYIHHIHIHSVTECSNEKVGQGLGQVWFADLNVKHTPSMYICIHTYTIQITEYNLKF